MSITTTPSETLPITAPLGLTSSARQGTASATLAMNELVAQRRAAGQDTLHMGFGEASFPLHPKLRTALADAATRTSYAPVLGLPALRQAIAAYLARTRQLDLSASSIIVAPGSKPLLYALLQVLEGDLLLPAPSWVSYAPQARLAGKHVIGVATSPDDAHQLSAAALSDALAQARAMGANPRILLVNSPSNPTGSMFSEAGVAALAGWARENGITLISDEIYAELAHGWREHVSPARFYPEGTIVTGGLSKPVSAGGWRLGYATLPATESGVRLLTAIQALASEIWSAAATPIQQAACVAFAPDAEIEAYVRASARVHGEAAQRMHAALVSLDITCPRPAGAFYLYPDFASWRPALAARGIHTSEELARHLLQERGIATLPGVAFGEPPDTLRLRLSVSMLYGPATAATGDEHEAALWRLLTQAGDEHTPTSALPLPLLGAACARWTEVAQALA